MKFAVLGNGAWGTALARLLYLNHQEVILWGIDKNLSDDINNNHKLTKYFQDSVILPEKLKSTTNLNEAVKNADALVFTIPTFAVRNVASEAQKYISKKVHIVTGAKGFEPVTLKRMSEVLREKITEEKRYEIVSLIGPSHAEEVIKDMLTAVTSTCVDLNEAKLIQQIFSNKFFRVYTNTDEIGAEYCAAIKNTIAIASGILEGLNYGDNARAALVTRSLAELYRLVTRIGGKFETLSGLAGLGDLMVTCNSYHSRNFQVGLAIGKANEAKTYLSHNTLTAEGIKTAESLYFLAKKYNIEMPICHAVYEVLYLDKKPSDLIDELMGRPLKSEK